MRRYGYEIDTEKLPRHIGIIMDGNGRWAKKRGLRRIEGHREGFKSLERIVKSNREIGVKYITFYAFSTENWKRPAAEVNFLMSMARKFLVEYLDTLVKNDIRFMMTGSFEGIAYDLRKLIDQMTEKTRDCKSYVFNVCFNYGGRKEILDAVSRIAELHREGKINALKLDEKDFSNYLYQPELPDPDLIIRTSGEQRISNFLLWECAYSELWFTSKLWPDFRPRDFVKAIYDFQNRKRRFGGV